MQNVFHLLLVALLLWALWWFLQTPCVFKVRIVEGQPRVVKGVATQAFLARVQEMCTGQDVQRGVVYAVRRGKRLSLMFSPNIPPSAQQQLRNWWAVSGWSGRA
jgi:hypothetical protein